MCAQIAINHLRVEPASESLVNEYRTCADGTVQSRLLDRAAHLYPGPLGSWRMLDDNDIALHHALGTVVSKWLQVRCGGDLRESLLAA